MWAEHVFGFTGLLVDHYWDHLAVMFVGGQAGMLLYLNVFIDGKGLHLVGAGLIIWLYHAKFKSIITSITTRKLGVMVDGRIVQVTKSYIYRQAGESLSRAIGLVV